MAAEFSRILPYNPERPPSWPSPRELLCTFNAPLPQPLHLHAASTRRVYCDNKHLASILHRKAIWTSSPARRTQGQRQPGPAARQAPLPGTRPPTASGGRHGEPARSWLASANLSTLGCGEGYCRALAERLPGWQVGGFDLAKNAIFRRQQRGATGRPVRHRRPGARPAAAWHGPGAAGQRPPEGQTELLVSWLAPGGYLLHVQPGPAISGNCASASIR